MYGSYFKVLEMIKRGRTESMLSCFQVCGDPSRTSSTLLSRAKRKVGVCLESMVFQ